MLLEQAFLSVATTSNCRSEKAEVGWVQHSLFIELDLVEDIQVPRDRDGSYQPTAVTRYQRRQGRVNKRSVRRSWLWLAPSGTRKRWLLCLVRLPVPKQCLEWPAAWMLRCDASIPGFCQTITAICCLMAVRSK
jgi:hypothetical protein